MKTQEVTVTLFPQFLWIPAKPLTSFDTTGCVGLLY